MADTTCVHLDALAEALAGTPDLSVVRRFDQARAMLDVANSEFRDGRGWELLSGTIFVIRERGELWYVWAQGDRLAKVDEIDCAVQGVKASLTFTEAEAEIGSRAIEFVTSARLRDARDPAGLAAQRGESTC